MQISDNVVANGNAVSENELALFGPLLEKLLRRRGIVTRQGAEAFIQPHYEQHTHDPFLMKGMEGAVERIIRAFRDNERIGIYSDYDADGIPGAVIFHDFFKKIGFTHFENYIPSRHDEGFGLHKDAVSTLKESGVTLLITIDCGITDGAEVAHAQALGIDVIITDHHEAGEQLPDAFAIIDPKQRGCPYPDKHLCGAGVAFKLVQALIIRLRASSLNPEPSTLNPIPVGWEKWLLDMAGLATLSDMVPLVGENRVFARYGLLVLRKSRRPGLQQLLQKLKVTQRFLTEDDITFLITPRINAASRMGEARDAFKLLAEEGVAEAGAYVDRLNEINDERKTKVAVIAKEAHKLVKERYGETIPRALVLGNPDWRPGLLGLVANSLVEAYRVPVFLWGRNGDQSIKGSCRGPAGVNLHAFMSAVPAGIFSDFGGHTGSGGFSVVQEGVHRLTETIIDIANRLEVVEAVSTEADAVLAVDDVTPSLMRTIEMLAPFGVGNPKPTFLFQDVRVADIGTFGKEKNHVKLKLKSETGPRTIEAISFFGANAPWVNRVHAGTNASVVASLEKSYFRGFPEIRLRIVGVK